MVRLNAVWMRIFAAGVASLCLVTSGWCDRVPDDCTELEYVEGDGSQYVRSGYTDGTSAYIYELDADLVQNGKQGGSRHRLNYTDHCHPMRQCA